MKKFISREQLKKDFPFLKTGVAYLDNASTTQKPQCLIDATTEYYTDYASNVHRGIYQMSERASEKYESAREQVHRLIGAGSPEEIIFTSGTTDSLNLAARLVAQELHAGDEIILTQYEHHSNLIPWQLIAKEKGLQLKFLELIKSGDRLGQIDPNQLADLITPKSKVLSITHLSNVSGYITPLQELINIAHENKMIVIVDAAQSVPHMPVSVVDIDADFLAFSAHKMCGPTGVGVLYGKRELLERFEPVYGGGSMIENVDLESATWAELPLKFEPGTPNIAGVIGMGAAIEYIQSIGMSSIHKAVEVVYDYALEQVSALEGITILGPTERSVRNSIISFTTDGIHPHDLATVLDQENVAVRAGHHCAQPLMKLWGVPATTRISLYFYNTKEDIDRCVAGIKKAQQIFHK